MNGHETLDGVVQIEFMVRNNDDASAIYDKSFVLTDFILFLWQIVDSSFIPCNNDLLLHIVVLIFCYHVCYWFV